MHKKSPVPLRLALSALALSLVTACGGTQTSDEDFPDGRITIIVPFAAGGSTDAITRQFATLLESEIDTSIVVENREGGGSSLGVRDVLNAEPDGHTLGFGSNGSVSMLTVTRDDLGFGGPADIEPIVYFGATPPTLAVRHDAPWDSVDELLTDAENRPGSIRLGVNDRLSLSGLPAESFTRITDVDMSISPFTGGGSDTLAALLGGDVDVIVGFAGTIRGQVESGDVRVLGTFTEAPMEIFPESTPLAEYYDNSEYEMIAGEYFIFGPRDIPAPRLEILQDASERVVASEEFQDYLTTNSYITEQLDPAELIQRLETNKETATQLIQDMGEQVVD